jgi:hypothetical protein
MVKPMVSDGELSHRCRRELRGHFPFPRINGVLKRLALDRDENAATTPIDFRHEQIVFPASGTFRHDTEIADHVTSTFSCDRPIQVLNVFVKQRVRFAVLHLKAAFLKPPLRHWASFPACALVALRRKHYHGRSDLTYISLTLGHLTLFSRASCRFLFLDTAREGFPNGKHR